MTCTMQKLLFFILLALYFTSCGSSNRNQSPARFNRPVLYNPASSSLNPRLGIYHISNTESQLYVVINTNELLVSEANPDGAPKSDIRIRYELFDCTDIENNKLVSDSSTFINSVTINQQQRIIAFPIIIPAQHGRRYLLAVQTTDLLRRNTIRQFISVNKTDIYSGQNFRLTSFSGSPKLDNTIAYDEPFRISYQRRPVDKLYVKYMNSIQPIATSPLMPNPAEELVFKPDSIWEYAYNPSTNFVLGYEGLYLIQTDTTKQEGLLLMNFGPSFPVEDRVAQLVQPIQYLVSENEFQRLCPEGVPKKMMDNFWLSATGSTDRARMMIRVFYTRMSYANEYFTDFKEGWKTDRGMIYMIYGLPNEVNKGSDSETWEYTRRQQANSLTFVFDKMPSAYSEDYFVLQRGDAQPTYWRQAIESWRRGRVFSINDLQ